MAEPIILGQLSGLFGVRGEFKVFSYTDPREAIGDYPNWLVRLRGEWVSHRLVDARRHARTVVARLEGIDDRDAAAALLRADVAVWREDLPPLGAGAYYWTDLVGLDVVTASGVRLGRVDRVFATGSNDVLVVCGDRERWLPFDTQSVIQSVEFATRCITVDWDPAF